MSTIDEAITQAKALTDFKHDKSKTKEAKSSHAKGERYRDMSKEEHPSKSHDRTDSKKIELQRYADKKEQSSKRSSYYTCGGPQEYASCLEMKNLGTML